MKAGILLMNLGGPDSLEAVRPFLYNLFSDPDIIRLPAGVLYQKPLAALIAKFRSPRIVEQYRQIGGKSPILDLTAAQARMLEDRLRAHAEARVYVGMSYWKPFVAETMAQMKADGVQHVVTLPLYPHYSVSTTMASDNGFSKAARKQKIVFEKITRLGSWYEEVSFLQAWADHINASVSEYLRSHDHLENLTILFSAHGIPVRYVKNGDPYPREVADCVERIMTRVAPKVRYRLSFQSKVGPVRWLEPYTFDAIKDIGKAENQDIRVVPISFVSDHIETLFEIDVEYGEVARHAGIRSFARVPSLNTSPAFIDALAAICLRVL